MDEASGSDQTRYISLLPGEDVLLREDSAILMGANSSEVRGVLFVTNYQLLFCGSFAQLPDESCWHGPSLTDSSSDLANKVDNASPVVARARQPKQKLRPRASVIEPSVLKGLRQTLQRSRSSEVDLHLQGEKRATTLPKGSGSPQGLSRLRASFSGASTKRPHSSGTFFTKTKEDLGELVESGNSRFFTSDTSAETTEDKLCEDTTSDNCVNGDVLSEPSPSPSPVRRANMVSKHVTVVETPATPEGARRHQAAVGDGNCEANVIAPDLTAASNQSHVPSTKLPPSTKHERHAKRPSKEFHHGNSSFFLGSARPSATNGETSDSSDDEEESPRGDSAFVFAEKLPSDTVRLHKRGGSRFFTNLRSDSVISTEILSTFKMKISLPLNCVARVKQLTVARVTQGRHTAKIPTDGLELCLKTGQVYKLAMLSTRTLDAVLAFSRDLQLRQAASSNHFAQVYAQAMRAKSSEVNASSRERGNVYKQEAHRLEITEDSVWHFVSMSQMAQSYTDPVIVPVCTPHVDLVRLAAFHRLNRFPVVSWMDISTGAVLLRSSGFANHLGDHTHHSPIHEGLLHTICTLNSSATVSDERLHVFLESRKSSPHAGSLSMEQRMSFYYPGCKFCYCEEFSIHSVRKSFKSLRDFLHKQVDPSKYFSTLEETGWLQQNATILSLAVDAASAIKNNAASVLVALEDGWDATTQVVSLAQVLLDPYYRTYEGFQRLIEKDWCYFSHQFADRHFAQAAKQSPKTEAPVFLQWIDCVWQVWRQFPSAFEFSSAFLEFLAREAYSGRFGTFLTNGSVTTSSTYTTEEISKHTVCLWEWLEGEQTKTRFLNSWYLPNTSTRELRPGCSVSSLQLWTDFYLWPFLQPQLVDAHEKAAAMLDQLIQRYQALQGQLTSLHDKPSKDTPPSVKKYAHLWWLKSEQGNSPPSEDSAKTVDGSAAHTGQDDTFAAGHGTDPGVFTKSAAEAAMDNSVCAVGAGLPTSSDNPQKRVSMLVYVSSTGKHGTTNLLAVLKEKGLLPGVENEVRVDKLSCCGNLDKMGAVHRAWKRRWFHLDLTKQYLAYFVNKEASSEGKQPKGVISLHDIGKIYQQEKKEMLLNHIFTVELQQRTWLLQAPSRETMLIWMACLQQARSP